MSTPYFNYGWNGFNSMDSLTNQYLQAALMAQNVNFKGDSSQVASADSAQAVSANNGGIPVIPTQTTQQEASGGSNFVTTALATAVIGGGALWMLKSGKFSQASKAIKSWMGKGESEASTVLTRLRAIKNGNGELKLQVPNKTKTFAGTEINTGVNEYGIKGAISAERQAFNPQSSLLNGFRLTTSTGEYKIVLKDGNPVSIIKDGKGGNILQRLTEAKSDTDDGKLLAQIKNIVHELGKDKKDINSTLLQDVKNIRFTNHYGDDTLVFNIKQYNDKPQLRAFRTLEQFDKNDIPVMQYKPSESEKIFNNELTKQDSILGIGYGKKTLVDGVTVLSVPPTEIAGAKCFFEGEKLVKIIKDGNTYEVDSNGFIQFVEKNEKAIEQFKKDVFVDKIADKIPTGALIGTV